MSRRPLIDSRTMVGIYQNCIGSAYYLPIKTRIFGRTDFDDEHLTFGTI